MSWVKLGDEFVDDAAELSDAAVRTYIDAVAWSNRRQLDLRVPKRDLRRFAFSPDADDAVKELLAVAWFIDDGDTWALAYRPEWQYEASKERVEARRESNLRAQWHKRGNHSKCLPGKCPHVVSSADNRADSADDTPADTPSDTTGDPGRDGTGRDGLTKEEPTELDNEPWLVAVGGAT